MRPSVEANLPTFFTRSATQQKTSPLPDNSDLQARDSFAQSLRTQSETPAKTHSKPITREPLKEQSRPVAEPSTPSSNAEANGVTATEPRTAQTDAEVAVGEPLAEELPQVLDDEALLIALDELAAPIAPGAHVEPPATQVPVGEVGLEMVPDAALAPATEPAVADTITTGDPEADPLPAIKAVTVAAPLEPTSASAAVTPLLAQGEAGQAPGESAVKPEAVASAPLLGNKGTAGAQSPISPSAAVAPSAANSEAVTLEPLSDESATGAPLSARPPPQAVTDFGVDAAVEGGTTSAVKMDLTAKPDDLLVKPKRLASEVAPPGEPLLEALVPTEDAPAPDKSDPLTRFSLPSGLVASGGRVSVPVTARFGSETWASEVAEQSAKLTFAKIHSAELQLDPPELGPLSVRIHVQQDQAVVSFVASNAAVKDALDSSMAKLKEMLQEQGMNLVDANVQDQSQQQRQRRNGTDAQALFAGDNTVVASNQTLSSPLSLTSGIDYFV